MKPIYPGATIGILGGGQLGRMLALEARRMGYRSVVLDPVKNGPAAQVADQHIHAELDDIEAALALARCSDVVTFEWELVPVAMLKKIAVLKPVRPEAHVLEVIQDRLAQKEFLSRAKFPQAPYIAVSNARELDLATKRLGFECILKRRRSGYDGKGQYLLKRPSCKERAAALLSAPCVLEAKVPFIKEVSVLVARAQDGKMAAYPLAENAHEKGVLRVTRAPAVVSPKIAKAAEKLGLAIAQCLGHVGVMAVEMFLLKDGSLLVNEIAPRVHNSGHFTWGACATSQFEQHIRAICGLPLGDPRLLESAVMVNLLGDLWADGAPDWMRILKDPNARLFLYGKAQAKPGRKMGHVLILGRSK